MNESIRPRFIPVVILCCVLLLSALACDLPGGDAPPEIEQEPAPSETLPSPTATLPPTLTPVSNLPSATEEGEPDASQSQDRLPCPDGAQTYWLSLTHHFWTDTGRGKWQWEAHGAVPLYLSEDNSLATDPLAIVPGRQYGEFTSDSGGCAFEAPAEISLSITGSCQDGWLVLDLWENWNMGTYQWQCDDDAFQFDLPPMDSASHPNLRFPLTGGESYVEFPWMGGSGSKLWSLLTTQPEIDTVPIPES